ncbi:MltA domain-containing protein [Asticcacaulis sp. EMRT-3]|uniref:MltA domain-containing protein n=1 Tax=Asticcacaulis sp. EMRT-3 TaxID=3040349 RepID=UPI0024AEA34D|nr:MltA domain-containing protein [Asticcacaulis sp. EMRT-3]MDI7775833.1 MltA domain-containing protein [Asticcacaulis sp. EMRT-3]
MRLGLVLSAGLALLLAACATVPVTPPVTPPVTSPVSPSVSPESPSLGADQTPGSPSQTYNPVAMSQRLDTLPGWSGTDPFIAIEALRAACAYKNGGPYAAVCASMARQDFESPEQIMAFLDSHLQVEAVSSADQTTGTLTGYYVPDYDARHQPDAEFSQAVRGKPSDLVYVNGAQMTPAQTGSHVAARKVGGLYLPYYTRAEIEAQTPSQMPADPMTDYYMRPEDYFFMQLQGSGFLDLPDGSRVYAAYAADNGQPFVGIARVMVQQGLLAPGATSGDNIHAWLAAHRGPEAQALMNANPRYGFFTIQPDQTEPLGAAGLALPPGSAIAVDPAYHHLGDLFWIDAHAGAAGLDNAFPAYQRLVAALDTGGAIKGDVRADLYVGHGQRAGTEAGRIKHVLRMYRIVPAQ